ncbi:MAG: MliC family protein [Lysobacter sp.]
MKILVAALAAIAGAGCVTTVPPTGGSAVREVAFGCDNNESMTVRFVTSREVAILMRNGESFELKQQPAASGFLYSNGPNTIRGKGDALTVEIGRMMPIQCKAR